MDHKLYFVFYILYFLLSVTCKPTHSGKFYVQFIFIDLDLIACLQ